MMGWCIRHFSTVCLLATTFLQVGKASQIAYNEPYEDFTLSRHSIQVPHQVDEFENPIGARSWRDLMVENATGRSLFRESVPVNGPFRNLAYFYTDAWVGTPSIKFSVIVDTGSSLMAFPCKGCKTCGKHEGHRYDPGKSSTSEKVVCGAKDCFGSCERKKKQCSYNQRYSEGSQLSGLVYRDKTYLDFPRPGEESDDLYGIKYAFGCHTIERGKLFHEQLADGILGLANRKQSFISALKKSNKLTNNQFSMCLEFNGGSLRIGGPNAKLHTGEMKWTNMKSTTSYGIKTTSMELSGTRVTSKGISGIVDSGTTFTILPRANVEKIKKAVNSYCAKEGNCEGAHSTRVAGESLCWKLDNPDNISTFPSLTINLQGDVAITIAPHHLFVNMVWDQKGKAYCLAVYPGGRSRVLLGANAMMNYDYLFDLAHGKLGIAPAQCRKPQSETEFNEGSEVKPPQKDSSETTKSDDTKKDDNPKQEEKKNDSPKQEENKGSSTGENSDVHTHQNDKSSTSDSKPRTSQPLSRVYAVGILVGVAVTAFSIALVVLAMTYCGVSVNVGSYQPMSVEQTSANDRGYAQV